MSDHPGALASCDVSALPSRIRSLAKGYICYVIVGLSLLKYVLFVILSVLSRRMLGEENFQQRLAAIQTAFCCQPRGSGAIELRFLLPVEGS